jgi:hypothetical protein
MTAGEVRLLQEKLAAKEPEVRAAKQKLAAQVELKRLSDAVVATLTAQAAQAEQVRMRSSNSGFILCRAQLNLEMHGRFPTLFFPSHFTLPNLMTKKRWPTKPQAQRASCAATSLTALASCALLKLPKCKNAPRMLRPWGSRGGGGEKWGKS